MCNTTRHRSRGRGLDAGAADNTGVRPGVRHRGLDEREMQLAYRRAAQLRSEVFHRLVIEPVLGRLLAALRRRG